MSQENVEIVRRSTDALNRRDLDGLVENRATDAVVDWSNSRGPEAGVYRGHDEIRAFAKRFLAAWDEVRVEIDDPIEVEDDVLVVENVAYLRGRDSIETQARSAWVTTFRDGQQTSLTLYQTKQEALEAAGLSEWRCRCRRRCRSRPPGSSASTSASRNPTAGRPVPFPLDQEEIEVRGEEKEQRRIEEGVAS
jgi:ketosteroid isomerase-like protein